MGWVGVCVDYQSCSHNKSSSAVPCMCALSMTSSTLTPTWVTEARVNTFLFPIRANCFQYHLCHVWQSTSELIKNIAGKCNFVRNWSILFLDATSYFFFDLLLFWWSLSSNWESVNRKKIFWELACLKMSLFYCHPRHNSFKLLKTAPHWSLGSNVAVEYFPWSFFYLVNFWIFSL